MAIGFLRVSKISRSTGATACARLAYVLRSRIHDPRIATTHDYRRKGARDVLASGLVGWSGSAEGLAQAMSLAERRGDACEGRSVILAVPHELNAEQSAELVSEWCRALNQRHGVACAWAIHLPDEYGDERNVHAHVVATGRRSDGIRLGEKARELDNRQAGPAAFEQWRTDWGRLAEQALRGAGVAQNVDMRSWSRRLAADGISAEVIEGEEHLGPARSAVERRGHATAAGARNRRRRKRRQLAESLISERGVSEAVPERSPEPMLHMKQSERPSKYRDSRGGAVSVKKGIRTANKLLDDLLDQVAKDAKSPDHER